MLDWMRMEGRTTPQGPVFPKGRTVEALCCVQDLSLPMSPPGPHVPIPIPGPGLLVFDVGLQSQCHLLLHLLNFLPSGDPWPVWREESHGGQKRILGILELQSPQGSVEAKEQL